VTLRSDPSVRPIVTAAPDPTRLFLVRSLETGDEAIVATTPLRVSEGVGRELTWVWRLFARGRRWRV
jgi:hypothetical protein